MAIYRTCNAKEYKGNPLIEALHKRLKLKDFMKKVHSKPSFSEEEIWHDDLEREIYSERLVSCVIPNDHYYDAYTKMYMLIMKAYVNRNPLKSTTTQIKYSIASGGDIPYPNTFKKTTADSIFISGLSGMGKSHMVESILSSVFEQIIEHDQYNDINLNFKQLLYVKFNCPGDASKRALLLNFFKSVDSATKNTNYEKENKYHNLRIHDLENNMKKLYGSSRRLNCN